MENLLRPYRDRIKEVLLYLIPIGSNATIFLS